MKNLLKKYGFDEKTVEIISPIIEAINKNCILEAEQKISKLSLDICDKVENGILSPKQADDYFTLIDLYITDNYIDLQLRKEIKDILLEGMLLHDYGQDYGANLHTIKSLARMVLKKNP